MNLDLSGRPLTDTAIDRELFVDRADELRKLFTSIEQRTNVLVWGPTGSGKTSFLHYAEAELRARSYAVTFIDAQPAPSVEDLLDRIRWRLGDPPSMPSPQPSDGRLPDWDVHGGSASLSRMMESLAAHTTAADRRILLVDAPQPEVGHALFGRQRDEVWQLPFLWIVAVDSVGRTLLTSPPADAFFPVTIRLGPLSTADACALLQRRLGDAVSSIDLARVVEVANGSPRLLLAIARELTINERSVDDILRDEAHRRTVVENLGDPARRLLSYLQDHGPSSASDENLLVELGWTRARATQVLNSLEDAGLVRGSRARGGRRRLFELVRSD